MPDAQKIQTARATLAAMGVTVHDLLADQDRPASSPDHAGGPNLASYLPRVLDALEKGTRRTYSPPLRLLVEGWSVPRSAWPLLTELADEEGLTLPADPPICDAPRPTDARPLPGTTGETHLLVYPGLGDCPVGQVSEADLKAWLRWIRLRARLRNRVSEDRRDQHGRQVVEHNGDKAVATAVAAARNFFATAAGDRAVPLRKDASPALDLRKPTAGPGRRRALSDQELRACWEATCTAGQDPELHRLLFRFHITSGARREGAIKLRLCDLDDDGWLYLREKGRTHAWVPCPPSLVAELRDIAHRRGAHEPRDRVLRAKRTRNGQHPPLTGRQHDKWAEHVQAALPWADHMGWGAHVLRHHAGTTIERIAGKAVAAAFLRHKPSDVTARYVTSTSPEVAAAVAIMTGEPHPAAPGAVQPDQHP